MHASLRHLALALLSIGGINASPNPNPSPQTGVVCDLLPAGPGPAVAVGLSPVTTTVYELTNSAGSATLTPSGYTTLLVNATGGPFGGWNATACAFDYLTVTANAALVIPDAQPLSWSPTISSTAPTAKWISAAGKDLVYAPTGTSTFFACYRDTIVTSPGTPVVYYLFLTTLAVDPPTVPIGAGFACEAVKILVK